MSEKMTGTSKKLPKLIKSLIQYNVTAKVSAEEKVCEKKVLPQARHSIVAASPLGGYSALEQRTQFLNFCFEASFNST